jgi:hypothetical protein
MGVLLAGVLLAGCGGSDEDKPSAPAQTDISAVSQVLVATMRQAFLAALISDSTSVPGTAGTLQIAGDNWTFTDYSPDGKLTMSGALVVEEAKYPEIPIKGTLQLKGALVGTLLVDMLVQVNGLEVSSTGTLTLDGTVYDVAQLIAASAASG